MTNRKSWLRAFVSLAIGLLLVPAGAGAYSFLPGGFDLGERIVSVDLVSGGVGSHPVVVDTGANPNNPSDDTFYLETFVSTISTNKDGGTIYNVPLGYLTAAGMLNFVGFPHPPGLFGAVRAGFSHSTLVDLTITDTGPGAGTPVLLEAEYVTQLDFAADVGVVIQGNINAELDVVGGEAEFVSAFGPGGTLSGVLAGFSPGGNDICVLTNSSTCTDVPFATDLADFTANTTATIIPIPEPGGLTLVGLGLLGLAARRRR